ncbi:MAG: serine protease, partial [Alphaproteobacteria bacterium]|nr:serine protease [Alphaproteobacteria bacterium]
MTIRSLTAFGLAVLMGVAAGLPAAAQQVPQSREQITLSYAPLVEQVAPAVVNIYATKVVETAR